MWCDVDTDKFSALQSNEHEDIELDEANGRGNEQIHGGDVGRMVTQKRCAIPGTTVHSVD